MEEKGNYFEELFAIDIAEDVKEKNGLKYVSWATAWKWVKTMHPDATYQEYEREDGRYWFDDGVSGWVKVGVTINGIEHIEHYPIMDFKNNSIPADKIRSTDANKAKMRALAKACARHGLGLYIYQGEDLKEDGTRRTKADKEQEAAAKELRKARSEVLKLCKERIEQGVERDKLYAIITELSGGNRNPSSLPSLEACEEATRQIKEMKATEKKSD
ncbi:DUF1071 domain-containing protein [Butyricicoccus sp. 1XD8-22]|nr:DUF1071 domain-containing protein [Butyricicoccus sp. 1XD8-22]